MKTSTPFLLLTILLSLFALRRAAPVADTPSLHAACGDQCKKNLTSEQAQHLDSRAAAARYGSCFDYCSGPDATGVCMRNVCTEADSCNRLWHAWHIESIMWQGGGTHCNFWKSKVCNGEKIWMPDPLPSASNWGWDLDRMNSFRCYRDF